MFGGPAEYDSGSPSVLEALDDTPVVLIQGPRQWGKTTFTHVADRKRGSAYFSFDDDARRNGKG